MTNKTIIFPIMKNFITALNFIGLFLLNAVALEVDCSMSDSTRCDCIYSDSPRGSLMGTDCRVCRIDKQLMCVLWGSAGDRYGPLCEKPECPKGFSWRDQKGTPQGCHCDWQPKEHERMPCTRPVNHPCDSTFHLPTYPRLSRALLRYP